MQWCNPTNSFSFAGIHQMLEDVLFVIKYSRDYKVEWKIMERSCISERHKQYARFD